MTKIAQKKKYLQALPKIVDSLKAGYQPEKIILFGSMVNPQSNSNDIDLFLVKNTSVKRLSDRAKEAEKYLPNPEIPVDLIIYTPDEVKKLSDESLLLHQVYQGKVLYG